MNNIAVYLRVSTNEQETANQLPAIMAWCESHGYNKERIVFYQENESAWKDGHQRELARLRKELQTGKRKFDYLVVWALDRLSRQGIAAILHLINSFETRGCKVVSIQESWTDMPGGMRELFIAIAGWSAKYESDRRSERVRAGLERARQAGKQLGQRSGSKDKNPRKKKGYLLRYADRV